MNTFILEKTMSDKIIVTLTNFVTFVQAVPEDASFLGQNVVGQNFSSPSKKFRHLRKISSLLSEIVCPIRYAFSLHPFQNEEIR